MTPWDTSCPDWEARIREGRSLMPDLPLFASEADMGLAFFDELRLPDVPGNPRLGDASGEWFRDLVRAVFGSWDPVNQVRMIRDFFALVPKGSSKTTNCAALLVVAMLMNFRPRATALFLGPTQAVADRAYEQAVGMIEESPDLKRRFRPRDHLKTIEDLVTKSEIMVATFDLRILTGVMALIAVLVDELHVLGKSAHTSRVLRQIRGGLDKTPEGFLVTATTQSDDVPAGAFKSELKFARNVRDGALRGKVTRSTLPLLYEFPRDIATLTREERHQGVEPRWMDPVNWPMVMPNIGRPITVEGMKADWESEREKGEDAVRIWASQHLNIEIGQGINNDGWSGADLWDQQVDEKLTLESLLARCEVVTIGVDGGGRDDLLGLAVIGREKETRHWLSWCYGWADPIVLQRRKEIAAQLDDFVKEESFKILDIGAAHADLASMVATVVASGLLPDKNAVGIDPNRAAALFEALFGAGVTEDMIRRLLQGPALAPAVYGLDIKLADATYFHADQALMTWVVGNAKVEQRGNADMITKQVAGRAKIDPLIALLQATILMSWNPSAGMLVTGADILTVI
ncbi:terminase TerL endonuclease subunit [Bradyrhizobium diazoefficiens]|uniref:Terminase n=2 Tax=Bradyrhizobium TaxID=374 RepID=A0A809YIJ5_9BRAD|nr:terminase TerL endonuclease subunit [Bradyrhizobium diazoefficiens]BCA04188.1 terminase [Bradyrhizobium diazoefficiens]BCA21545.1 terminase [Bradyrhizobium diazoefficiens]BCE39714.1 terminase [Bradyrhizobium diazoefficiens]BCF53110.1 terminase [Bradyrhizobium diazoefficiens]